MAPHHIHEELLSEILKRLPVKTLIRFQSVCKPWISLMSSPFFSKTHHSFNSASDEPPIYLQQSDGSHCTLHHEEFIFPIQQSPYLHATILDVIHGVIVFSYWSPTDLLTFIALWNPRVSRQLSTPLPQGRLRLYGAGFDASGNDFKVVWVPGAVAATGYYKLFSSRTGAWKKKKWMLSDFAMNGSRVGRFVNGAIYWMTKFKDKGGSELVYFDCMSERFGRMKLPGDLYVRPKLFVNDDGLLSIGVKEKLAYIWDTWVVWTMKKYGEWSKEPSVRSDVTRWDALIYGHTHTYVFKESMLLFDKKA